jgi:serine/threonine protein kinase
MGNTQSIKNDTFFDRDLRLNKKELQLLLQMHKNMDNESVNYSRAWIIQEEDANGTIVFKYENSILKKGTISIDYHNDYFNQIIHETIIYIYGISQLDSVNFPKFNWFLIENGTITLCVQYIKGITLAEYLKNATDITAIITIVKKILKALYYAHEKINFTHYDLHPSNILINESGEPVIIDFGSSHIKFNGQDYGREYIGRICNTEMWFHDVIKILFWVLISVDDYYYYKILMYKIDEKMHTLKQNYEANPSDYNNEQIKEYAEKIKRYIDSKSDNPLVTMLLQLLGYFFQPLEDTLLNYQQKYKWFQPSDEIILENSIIVKNVRKYQFSEFMKLVENF